MKLDLPFRIAKPDDAPDIARLLDLAADGIVEYLWSTEASPDQSAFAYGEQQCRLSDSWCTYQNAIVVDENEEIAALALAFPLTESAPDPDDKTPVLDVLQPFVKLERLAVGTYYIDSLAVKPQYRKKGYAHRLLQLSEKKAIQFGYSDLSLQVFEENYTALQLYKRSGFQEAARHPVVTHRCHPRTGDIILMTKSVSP